MKSRDRGKELPSLKEELLGFYSHNLPDLSMITDLNRRHFRVALPSGRFMKIPDVIKTPEGLRKWLLRLAPFHVYYSTGCWLNPVTLKPRPKKPGPAFLGSGIILSHDIAFDIDRTPLLRKNIDAARRDALRLLDLMGGKGYDLKYAAFSGSKGFHLVFRDPDDTIIEDPYEREMRFIGKRTGLTEEIVARDIGIDTTVTKDTRRIFRVPGTINIRTGYACTALSRADMEKPVKQMLEGIPGLPSVKNIPAFNMPELPGVMFQTLHERVMALFPGSKNVKSAPGKQTRKEIKQINSELPQALRPGFYYTTYLQSCVPGTKGRHAVLISFRDRTLKSVERTLLTLVEKYSLTDFYLFDTPGRIIAVSLGTVQRNRYQKILGLANAENAQQLMKYDVASVRVGGMVDKDMNEKEPHIKFIKTVESGKANNEKYHVSAGHLNFIRKHGIETFDYPNVHGSGEFKLVDAVLKM